MATLEEFGDEAKRRLHASVRDRFFGESAIDCCWLGVAAFCDTLSLGELLSAAPDLGSASRNARLKELWESHLHALRRHARKLLRKACNGSTSIGSCKTGRRRRGAWSLSTVPAQYDCVSFATAGGVSAGMISDIISRQQGKVQLKTTGGDEPQYTVVQLVEATRRDKEAELEEPGQWCFTASPFTPTPPCTEAGWRSEALCALWHRQSIARLQAEFLELKLWPLPGFRVELGDSGVTGAWHCVIPGMQGTFLQNTEFKLDMFFNDQGNSYPIRPPKLVFAPAVFHVNVYPSGTCGLTRSEGEGYDAIFGMNYVEGTTPRDLLLHCEEFLACTNKLSPAQSEPYHMFLQCEGAECLPYLIRLRNSGSPVLRAPGERYGASAMAAEDKILIGRNPCDLEASLECRMEAALDAREKQDHTKALLLEGHTRVEQHVA
jgi:ubiquitin-protein ligase